MSSIYLDYASTAPLLPEVAAAMAACDRAGYANPASQHAAGRRARRVLEEARAGIARLLGARVDDQQADQLVFTSGGTEANNLALFGFAAGEPGQGIVSAIEHPSVAATAEQLTRRGWRIDRLPATKSGLVDIDRLADRLTPETRFVSVMLGNNETGVVQPAARIAELCRQAGVPLHTDAAQTVGKTPVDFRALGATALSVAAHKFHGPRGIGALLLRNGARIEPQLFGGFQQEGLRPGTESIALAVGMHTALGLWRAHGLADRVAALRDEFEARLLAESPELVVNGGGVNDGAVERLPHISNIAFPGVNRQAMLMALDLEGVACSTGSACASGSSEPSPVLLAMGLEKVLVDGSLRFSFGASTTHEEVARATERIQRVYKALGGGNSASKLALAARGEGPTPL